MGEDQTEQKHQKSDLCSAEKLFEASMSGDLDLLR